MIWVRLIAFILLLVGATSVRAEEANEGEMFGLPSDSAAPAETDVKSTPKAAAKPDPKLDAFARGEVTDNPLQIGGTYYQRFGASALKNTGASGDPVTAPSQFDLYLDGRPSDRVRGFVDVRTLYDSSRDQYGNPAPGTPGGSTQFSSGASAPTGLTNGAGTAIVNPEIAIDQAWLKFDIDHTVFVTAGKQHLKWGTSRFWNPTDLLSGQVRDPLLPYDLRLGTNMVKMAIPLEGTKSNLYAITLLEGSTPGSTVGELGEALRAETVLGSAELGVDAIYRFNTAPVYGADISAPLGPFDIYLEGAYFASSPVAHYDTSPEGFVPGSNLATQYTQTRPPQGAGQISGGANYSFPWEPNRLATVGAEYFHNELGYANDRPYPVLIFLNQYQPFYTGRDYAAFYITAEGPDVNKHTSYTFTTLANLSDSSYITRLDFSWRFLTYLTFDSFVAGHFGREGGEFNFALNTPAITYQGNAIPALVMPPSVVDLGVALRMGF